MLDVGDEVTPGLRRIINRGGPGSGHFGHQGRPGERGGSLPGGAGMGSATPVSDADTILTTNMRKMDGMMSHPGRSSNYGLTLEHGRYFTPAERPKDIPKMENKACYENASLLALRRPDLTYVEGFATIPLVEGMPFAHAWLVDHKGTVIDPTWEAPGTSYFGIPFTTEYLQETLLRNKVYGMLPDIPTAEYDPGKNGFREGAIKR